jgi:glycosyltransferase involved in cell wall biosynthesis
MNAFAGVTVIAKPNGGQISAAVEGFRHARGDIILFLDSDDHLLPQACSVIARHYAADCAMYQYKLEMRDSAERRVGEYPREPFVRADLVAHLKRFGYIPSSPTSGNAFGRDHVARMFTAIDDMPKLYFDGYLIYSAPFVGSITIIDETLGIYRVHGSNVSLSAGLTVKSAKNDILNAIWQRKAIVHCLSQRGAGASSPVEFLSPYHLRNALILKVGYPEETGMDFLSTWGLALSSLRKFIDFPNLSIGKRVKNMLLVLLLPLGPAAVARAIIPRERSFSR